MKTKILFVSALLAVSTMSGADTLSNLLNDIPKNVSVVEKTGTCDTNFDISSGTNDGDVCPPVIAQCGKGKTILPSECEIIYSDDGTKPVKYMSSEVEVSKIDFINGTQTCNVRIGYMYPPMEGSTTRDVTVKATARCVKTPANFVQNVQNTAKKLGITIK